MRVNRSISLPIDAGGVEGLPQGIPTPESPDYDLESVPLTNTP